MSENQKTVLAFLSGDRQFDVHCPYPDINDCIYPFDSIVKGTGLERRIVRIACRALARMGCASLERGFDEEGLVNGSGYSITQEGARFYSTFSK